MQCGEDFSDAVIDAPWTIKFLTHNFAHMFSSCGATGIVKRAPYSAALETARAYKE